MSEIITPDNQNPKQNPELPEIMTLQLASTLAQGVRRLRWLRSQSIATPQGDAEIRGITAMLSHEVPKYADELIGCWLAVHQEYEPLIEAVAVVLRRASESTARRNAALQAQIDSEKKQ